MKHPDVRVGLAVFIFRDGKFLMLKRRGSHESGTWAPPGGHVEFGESFEATARREAKEETNLTITDVTYVGTTNDPLLAQNKHYVTIWMTSNAGDGTERIMEPDKCEEMKWCDFSSLPEPLFYNFKTMMASDFFNDIQEKLGK